MIWIKFNCVTRPNTDTCCSNTSSFLQVIWIKWWFDTGQETESTSSSWMYHGRDDLMSHWLVSRSPAELDLVLWSRQEAEWGGGRAPLLSDGLMVPESCGLLLTLVVLLTLKTETQSICRLILWLIFPFKRRKHFQPSFSCLVKFHQTESVLLDKSFDSWILCLVALIQYPLFHSKSACDEDQGFFGLVVHVDCFFMYCDRHDDSNKAGIISDLFSRQGQKKRRNLTDWVFLRRTSP